MDIYAPGEPSNLTVELYLDNKLLTSVPYNHGDINRLDLKNLHVGEQDRTLTFRKNIMVRFTQNGRPYLKMGIGCASPGLPAGHIQGRLKNRNRLLPKSTYHCLTDHNKNITGLINSQGNLTATWDYDAFGNIIQQTGSIANRNPLRFSSEYHDEDLGLIYYNYRHYNPKEGRWISRDMLSGGSDNPYAFIHNASQGIDILGLDYRPYTNGMGCSPSTYDSSDFIAKQLKEQQRKQCQQKRKEKMEMINQLISEYNPDKPDCSSSPKCKHVTIVVEVSDPCKGALSYGHTGIAFENEFKDLGTNYYIDGLTSYWSADYPDFYQLNKDIGIKATAPTLKIEFCACENEFNDMKKRWGWTQSFRDTVGVVNPFSSLWGTGGTCATGVAISLGLGGNVFMSPDDILTDIVPYIENSCGGDIGYSAHIELMEKANTFKD